MNLDITGIFLNNLSHFQFEDWICSVAENSQPVDSAFPKCPFIKFIHRF